MHPVPDRSVSVPSARSTQTSMKRATIFLVLSGALAGCPDSGTPGNSPSDTDTSSGSGTTSDADSATTASSSASADESSTGWPEPQGPSCREDHDRDTWPAASDNADGHFNPTQLDRDGDGVGDVVDLCALSGGDESNTADSDRDGVGNACDRCRSTLSLYNAHALSAEVPERLLVRNNPVQRDADGDGIGDACDNCVTVPNCQGFSPDAPFEYGDPIDIDAEDCQADANFDMVGDACEGLQGPDAAGPVGFGPDDDFDQDGLRNSSDACPRIPLPGQPIACAEDTALEDCGEARQCVDGVCGHVDHDSDGFGDLCDSCPEAANPQQHLFEDDEDGDFIGDACESVEAAADRSNQPPPNLAEVSALGLCCTVELLEVNAELASASTYEEGDLIRLRDCELDDPDSCQRITRLNPALAGIDLEATIPEIDIPLRRSENCSAADVEAGVCAQLPEVVENTPGVLVPPAGCEAALAEAGLTAVENSVRVLTADDFAGEDNPDDVLWRHACRGPALDEDFDGIVDRADMCPISFDPSAAIYVDITGREWPNDGAACNGDFSHDRICELRAVAR